MTHHYAYFTLSNIFDLPPPYKLVRSFMEGSYVATNSNTKLGDLALFCIPLFSRTNASALSLDLFCNNVIILIYLVTRNSNKSPYYDK